MSVELKKIEQRSIIAKKAYLFSLEIIEIYKTLKTQNEFDLCRQILRSGTSIGANANEAIAAESKKDFVHKLSISLKEARETSYWLNLLHDTQYISEEKYQKLISQCDELIRILSSIILTTKERYLKKENSKTINSEFKNS